MPNGGAENDDHDEYDIAPVDVTSMKLKLLAPLVQSMQLISPKEAGRLLAQMGDSEIASGSEDDGSDSDAVEIRAPRTMMKVRAAIPTQPLPSVITSASTAPEVGLSQGGMLSLDMLSGIDLDALLHSLERGSAL